jgi:hypothetical protein
LGFVEYDAVERLKVKESGLSEVEYYKPCQASREQDLERFNVSGILLPLLGVWLPFRRLLLELLVRRLPPTW